MDIDTAPIKMMHVFPSFSFGGQQARFAALAKGLGNGFSHKIFSLDNDFSAEALVSPDVEITYEQYNLKKSIVGPVANWAGFRKLFENHSPDIICTYNWGSIDAAWSTLR